MNTYPPGTIDPFQIQRALVRSGNPVIFDVGAYIGDVTKKYRMLFPEAKIHSFEPYPPAYEQLKRNHHADSMITIHNLAISDKRGKIVLNANTYSPTNSLLLSDARGKDVWGDGLLDTENQVEVETTTIDLFCKKNDVAYIDILKLDIQGAEYLALSAAGEMLGNQSIALVYMELILAPTYKGQHKFHEYLELFDSYGYDLVDIYNPIRHSIRLIQVDTLFMAENYKRDALLL